MCARLSVCAGICVQPDEFLTTVNEEKEERRRQREALLSEMRVSHSLDKKWPLDPLIAGLTTFTSHEDLRTKIAKVESYAHIDPVHEIWFLAAGMISKQAPRENFSELDSTVTVPCEHT